MKEMNSFSSIIIICSVIIEIWEKIFLWYKIIFVGLLKKKPLICLITKEEFEKILYELQKRFSVNETRSMVFWFFKQRIKYEWTKSETMIKWYIYNNKNFLATMLIKGKIKASKNYQNRRILFVMTVPLFLCYQTALS